MGSSDSRVASLAMSEQEQAMVTAAAAQDGINAEARLSAKLAAKKAKVDSIAAEMFPGGAAPIAAKVDEESLRKLFQLLDRSKKNMVSKRDVLVAVKKHAPVRVLLGLPAGSAGDSGDLQTRINAVQDAFESSSGLGELGTTFDELSRAADGSGQHITWDGFLLHFQQDSVRELTTKAVALLPREHAVGEAFEATSDWQVVPEGAA